MIAQKFAAALLPALGILLTAVQVMWADERFDDTEAGQLIVLVAGLFLTFIFPLLKKFKWSGALKTGFAVLAAIGTLIVPTIIGFNGNSVLIFLIALINALATEIGVQMRTLADAKEAQIFGPLTEANVLAAPYDYDSGPNPIVSAEVTYPEPKGSPTSPTN